MCKVEIPDERQDDLLNAVFLRVFIDVEAPKMCCPISFFIDSAATAALTWNKPTISDNSGQIPTVTCSPESGSQFMIGATGVVCRARDSSGNQGTCAFTVRIKGEVN